MKLKNLRTLLFGAVFCSLLTVSAFAANVGGGSVNAEAVNLRTEASLQSEVIRTVAKDTPVVVTDDSDSQWYKVWVNGSEGYMSRDYINFSKKFDASFGEGEIRGTNVRIRSGAGTDSNILASCNTGDRLSVVGVDGQWYKINRGGCECYVSSDYLALQNQTITVPAVSSDGAIVSTAKQYLGVPYVWAGSSPRGFDCSGFVNYVFKTNGYDINRTAASIFNNGSYVDRASLIPGDVICFTDRYYSYIGHVGIYIGGGEFIHASSSGGKVEIDSLSANYYNNHYYGARRIAN